MVGRAPALTSWAGAPDPRAAGRAPGGTRVEERAGGASTGSRVYRSCMSDHDRSRYTWSDTRRDAPERREPVIGPPIEREHETQAGVFEEDERRERERERR